MSVPVPLKNPAMDLSRKCISGTFEGEQCYIARACGRDGQICPSSLVINESFDSLGTYKYVYIRSIRSESRI